MVDREWREAIDLRSSLVSIGLVVVSGALLRYWNLRNGLVAPLETEVIDPVLQLMHAGSYRPQALTQPTLPVYLHALVAIVHFILGAIAGARAIGRRVRSGAGRRLGSRPVGASRHGGRLIVSSNRHALGARHALLAAGLMAVMPTHVAVSRQIGQESPLTFFSALSLLLSLVAIERGGRRRFIIAGAAAGLAAASHYAGVVVVIMPLVAAWMTRSDDSSRVSRATAVSLAALAAFIVATPLSVRDLPGFLNGLAIAAAPSGSGMAGHAELLQQLVVALQWPGVILAFAGLSLGIVRAVTGPGHTRWTLLVSFPVVYFTLVAWHGAASETILLPLLPAATVLAAIAVISGVSLLRRFDIPRAARTALIAALTVVAVLPPAVFSIELVRQAGRDGVSARADRHR